MSLSKTLLVLASLAVSCGRLNADPLYDAFRQPATETRPFVRWWWNGGRVEAAEITRELEAMKAAGIGGVEINTIGMPEGASAASLAAHPAVDWLSPEWCALVRATAEAAHQRGMTADLLVGSGWPFGGRFLAPGEQTQRVTVMKRLFQGPMQLTLKRAGLLEPSKPRDAENPPPTQSELLFLRLVPASPQGKFAPGREWATEFDAHDAVIIDVPPGDFALYVGVRETGFAHVKLGAPGADGPVVDHFNAAAVRKYLDHLSTHLAPMLNGNLGSALRAMFVDSLELDGANWTGDFAAEFQRRRGYELQPYLPFVLEKEDGAGAGEFAETVRRARYDFDRTLVELFDERFTATYVAWATENHVKARMQAYGRETHPLHGSMKVHLPEGESWLWLDPHHKDRIRVESTVVNKYVASAANMTGQRLRSFEAMTNAVPVFRETLQDFKRAFDATILAGLNHPIIHGFNYTPPDAGFPGWVRFGCYLNDRNPWWPHFRQFTDYAARVGTVMRASDAHARVAILAPRPDEWSKHGLLYQPFPEVVDPWYQYKLSDAIQQAGYNADYLSEEILARAELAGGRLRFGHCSYEVLILEDVVTMSPAAAATLAKFVAGGGRVIFIGQVPFQAPGLQHATENAAQVRAAVSAIRQAPADRVQFYPAPVADPGHGEGVDEQHLLDFVIPLLARARLTPDVAFDHPRRTVAQLAKRDGARQIYFLANADVEAAADVVATFPGATGRPYLWNPETGTQRALAFEAGGKLRLELEPAGSALVVFAPGEAAVTLAQAKAAPKPPGGAPRELHGPWKLELAPAGPGERLVRTLPALVELSCVADDEAVRSFAGVATYEIDFDGMAPGAGTTLDLGAVHDISEVTLNGVALGSRWWGRHRYDVGRALRPGTNHLQIKVTTVLVNLMRLKKDDAMAQRWAGWEPPIPMGLMGPVRLIAAENAANNAALPP